MVVPTVSYRAIWLCGYIKDISVVCLVSCGIGRVLVRSRMPVNTSIVDVTDSREALKVVIVRMRFVIAASCCRSVIKRMNSSNGR